MDTKKIVTYLKKKYQPHTIINYGPFSGNPYTPESDFDVLVISDTAPKSTDNCMIDNVPIDASIYNTNDVLMSYSLEEFVPIFNGRLLLDEQGMGKELIKNVRNYISNCRKKTMREKLALKNRIRISLARTRRKDTEGKYYLYQLLINSLEYYFALRDIVFEDEKRALEWLFANRPKHYQIYSEALKNPSSENVSVWIRLVSDEKDSHL